MNKPFLYTIVIIIVLLVGWFFLTKNKKPDQTPPPVSTDTAQIQTSPADTTTTPPITNTDNKQQTMQATLHTSKGDITVEFFAKDAPKTVANFEKLAKEGFYDGIKFHRVIKGFMIQGGDPLTKDDSKASMWGTGGPGYKFADEIDPKSDLYKTGYAKGILAMANSGPNTNGSQFFIMTADYPLPPLYVIFGKVDSGQDVVDAIAQTPTDQNDRPLIPVVIKNITVK